MKARQRLNSAVRDIDADIVSKAIACVLQKSMTSPALESDDPRINGRYPVRANGFFTALMECTGLIDEVQIGRRSVTVLTKDAEKLYGALVQEGYFS